MTFKFTLGLILSFSIISCAQETGKESNNLILKNDSTSVTTAIKPLLKVEEAETIVAKFYSAQNTKAGYPVFKGLFLQIDSVNYSADTAIAYINATVIGRRQYSENDTVTKSFKSTDTVQARLAGRIWTPAL